MTEKIGRNDPCPCGSGKKYKKCCLGTSSDPAKIVSLHRGAAPGDRREYSRIYSELVAKLADVVHTDKQWRQEAERAFFSSRPEHVPDFLVEEIGQVFGYFTVFDLPRPGSMMSIAEKALSDSGFCLSDVESELLGDALRQRSRIVEIKRIEPGKGMDVEDLTSGEHFFVHEKIGTEDLVAFDLLLLRLRKLKDWYELDWVVPLSRADRNLWSEVIEECLLDIRTAEPCSQPEDVFLNFLPTLYWMSIRLRTDRMSPPSVSTYDGEELMFCQAVYDVVDMSALLAALSRHRSFVADEQDHWSWLSGRKRKGPAAGKRIVMGHLAIVNERAILEVQSQQRLNKGKALLAKVAGDALHHRVDTTQTLEQSLQKSEELAGSLQDDDLATLSDEQEAALARQALDDYYRTWLDQQLPALEGLTPRQAASDPVTRAMILQLLKDFENSSSRGPNAYDFGWLYQELGLDRP